MNGNKPTANPSIESLLFKHVKDGPAGYVIRMRETHGTWVEDGVLRGCLCGDVFCSAYIWLAHIDALKQTTAQIQAQFQQETLASSSARTDCEQADIKVGDLAMLCRLLVQALRKYNPDSETARKTMDYLVRNNLQGSILRGNPPSTDTPTREPKP